VKFTDSTNKNITFNYYSPDVSPVQLQLVPASGATINTAVEAKVGWQVITIDASAIPGYSSSAQYIKIVLFPDFVNKGDVPGYTGANATAVSNQVYYVDNFAMNGATTPAIPVAPATVAPAVTKAAAITGTAKVGKTLTAAATFSGTPDATKTYKWYRCTVAASAVGIAAPAASAKCTAISGATAATYKVAAADVGKYIRVMVTARNSAGSKISLSKTTAKATK